MHPKQTKLFLMQLAKSKECICNQINNLDPHVDQVYHRCFRCQLIEFLDSANIPEED